MKSNDNGMVNAVKLKAAKDTSVRNLKMKLKWRTWEHLWKGKLLSYSIQHFQLCTRAIKSMILPSLGIIDLTRECVETK